MNFIHKRFKLLLALFLLFTATQSNTYAIEYNNIGGRPAFPQANNPRTESIFMHEVNPGQIIDEGVYVINNSDEEKTLQVYAADSTKSTDGGYACKQLSEEKTGVGSWITLSKDEVVLGPKQKELVPFTIAIPANADVGEFNGCILIQEKKGDASKPGVNISFRTGIRVMLTVPGRIIKELNTNSFTIEKLPTGNYRIVVIASNGGNVSVDANLAIVIRGLFGNVINKYGGTYSVLRGDVSRWNFDLRSPFWGGWYWGLTTISFNQDGGPTTLSFPSVRLFVIPHPIAIGIYILSLIAITALVVTMMKRKKEKQDLMKSLQPYVILRGQDIQSVAQQFDISWKKLARLNDLRPPYTVKEGMLIKVPKPKRKT